MLSRLTLRWRLTLLHTAMFLIVTAVVVAMVYLQNRVVIMRISADATPVDLMPSTSDQPVSGETARGSADPSMEVADGIAIQQNEALASLLAQWIVALTAMTVLAGLLAWWVTGRVLKRVHQMTSQARRISTENLHERLALQGRDDEIKELSDTFDAVLARLENAFNAQARFIANASHELRTPLAVARTTLQVGLATTDPARVRRVREELLRNNDRCTALINGLLTLARGEQDPHRLEPVDLVDVVHDVAGELTATGPADRPRLRIDAPMRCMVLGDPVLLAQLVHNLLGNALRYNVPGGEVLVELDTRGSLTIGNTGAEISHDEADRLFEPFYRGAVRTGRADGAGLGLSIVRAIARSCGGGVTARPRHGGGLVVEVGIPATPSDSGAPVERLPGMVIAG
ncbi:MULTISPECIES: sensor histidine kinase [Actinoalloteichus]|uniref:histidine kinase n=1 Tax=Actinoalloteichus fjordicus TaxID=1612552 RepID=A0AAC9PRA3_9PSEU|nr:MULTISPECIES: HAMP domain-containing sensor histidine kinase [Actinoalloteichus]APU13626.1 signal transduction histidine kinase [Actinoalloteichus fjordicus]APU19572.1 signal transduction histidine kinase [Actinoalloteichus sp. GBA129-24]